MIVFGHPSSTIVKYQAPFDRGFDPRYGEEITYMDLNDKAIALLQIQICLPGVIIIGDELTRLTLKTV